MVEGPVSLHILWEEEGLLQSLGYMTGVPPTIMPEGGIIHDGHTIHLQLGRPSADWSAHLSHMRLLLAINRVGPPAPLVL